MGINLEMFFSCTGLILRDIQRGEWVWVRTRSSKNIFIWRNKTITVLSNRAQGICLIAETSRDTRRVYVNMETLKGFNEVGKVNWFNRTDICPKDTKKNPGIKAESMQSEIPETRLDQVLMHVQCW